MPENIPSSSMASTPLPLNATLDAYAHCCTVSQVEELLARTPREWLRTHGHIAVARAMEFNKDPLGVMRVLLEHPEIQVNSPVFGGEEGNTILHLAVIALSMHGGDENEENLKGALLLILKRPDLDPNLGNSGGDKPLHEATRASSEACVDILLDDPRVNLATVNHNRQTCLHVACDVDARLKETIDLIARKIIKSARSTVRSFPRFLRKEDRFGNTALHYAAARGLENIVHSICEAESLSSKHVLASKKNHRGNLAIHLAAKNGHRGVVERMLVLVDDSHVANVKVHNGFGLVHHAVQSGSEEILRLCIQRLPLPTRPTFDLYMELLAAAPNQSIADYLLQGLNDEETVKKSEDKEADDYLAKLLHFAVSTKHEKLVKLIVKWYPEQAVVAMHEAMDTGNKTILAVLRDHPKVRQYIEDMQKNVTNYVTAANAILVVSVLIIALTFGHCLTSVEAAQHRKDRIELLGYGAPSGVRKVQWTDFILLPRWAFIQAMVATILAAFASLPFSFAFFFHEVVDDTKVKGLLSTTRVLIVSAAYFLMLSIGALFFSFVCSQFIAPYIDYHCAHACEAALSVFLLCATLFLGYNFVHFWRTRREGKRRGHQVHGDAQDKVEPRESDTHPLRALEIESAYVERKMLCI